MANYGYARVSGIGQDLEAQLQELEKAKCDIIFDEKVTGMKVDRKEFQKLLNQIEEGDTLSATKLDRFARSAEDGVKLIRELLGKGVKVHILNMGLIEDTPMGRGFFLSSLPVVLSTSFLVSATERNWGKGFIKN